MDYGLHLVTMLVCFVKAEGGRGLLSVGGGALVLGGCCPGAFVRGALVQWGLMSGGLMSYTRPVHGEELLSCH